MAKIIDDETMENVCILAKLSLTEDEKEKAKEDMQKMLDYVDKLDELDTSSVEPMSHIFEDENVFRDDVVTTETTMRRCLPMHRSRKKTSIRFRKQLDKTGDRTWIWEN